MIGTGGNTPRDQLAIAFEKNQSHVLALANEDVAIRPLEGGAGHNAVISRAPGGVDPCRYRMQPRPAIFVVEWLAVMHLLNIGLRVEPVAVLVNPMQSLR